MQLTVTLNGKELQLDQPVTIHDLLIQLDVMSGRSVIAYQGEIVPRDLYESTLIQEGSEIEIIPVMAGG